MHRLLAGLLLVFAQTAWSAENDLPDQGDVESVVSGEEQIAAESAQVDSESTAGLEDSLLSDNEQGGQAEVAGEEGPTARFIPTEQISQDLGVSFPVDI